MITTNHDDIAQRIRIARDLGKITKYDCGGPSPNTKLDTLQAVILRHKLPGLDAMNRRRVEYAARYDERLSGIEELARPEFLDDGRHVYHLYVVRSTKRDELRGYLREQGINAGVHYPVPPHLQTLGAKVGYPDRELAKGSFPLTEALANEVLSLPISPELELAEIDEVCDAIESFFSR